MTIDLILMLSVTASIAFFAFLRVIKLEFEVAKLNRLVEYLMVRGHDDRP